MRRTCTRLAGSVLCLASAACDGATEPGSRDNPVPVLFAVQPVGFPAGSGGALLTLSGRGFIEGSVANLNGAERPTTFVSPTDLTVTLSAADLATPGYASVAVYNPPPGGGTSLPAPVTVERPEAFVDSVVPSRVPLGSSGLTVHVFGSGFVDGPAGSRVLWRGHPVPTSFVNDGELTARVEEYWLQRGELVTVHVVNPPPGGGSARAGIFAIENPVPSLSRVEPDSVTLTLDAELLLTGSDFVDGATVRYDSRTYPATYLSDSTASVRIPGEHVIRGGAVVRLENAAPGGGASNPISLVVRELPPIIARLSPPSVIQGASDFTLSILGGQFAPDASISLDGSARVVTYVDEGELRIPVSVSDLSAPGLLELVVTNPRGGGSASSDLRVLDADAGISSLVRSDVPTKTLVYDRRRTLAYNVGPECFVDCNPLVQDLMALDPVTGELVWHEVFGWQPGLLAISHDANTLHVAHRRDVSRIHLDTRSILDAYAWESNVTSAQDVEALPSTQSSVVHLWHRDRPLGIFVLDGAVSRPTSAGVGYAEIAVRDDPLTVYAYQDEVPNGRLGRFLVVASGIVEDLTVADPIGEPDVQLVYGAGRLFASNGAVVDASTLQRESTLPVRGGVHVDQTAMQLYVLAEDGTVWIFDLESLQLQRQLTVPDAAGLEVIVRWGSDGLVLGGGGNGTSQDRVLFVRSPFVG